jgi:F-type H+-transporting ATPase subunit a
MTLVFIKIPFSQEEHIDKRNDTFSSLLIFTFLLILTANLIGLTPYSFTITSSLIVALSLTIGLFHTANASGFYEHN